MVAESDGQGKQLRDRVDFVVAGAQKSGTRALGHFLSQHPDIGLSRPDIPETHFFDRRILRAEAGDYSGYHALFSPQALARVTGDITPIYLYLAPCLARIHAYNPDMKVIVILRNPIRRAYSQWVMQTEMGVETRSFVGALSHEALYRARHGQHPYFSYVQRGFYAAQLERLFAWFPRRNSLIIKHEVFRVDYAETLCQVQDFLGVRKLPLPPQREVHSRSYPPMPALPASGLRQVFRRDIRRLETLLGWDCSDWLRPS